jgi:membrane protease YdiL (CAAX protease family)
MHGKAGHEVHLRRVRRPRAEALFGLVYAALYIGHLFGRQEGEASHWLTLVVVPALGLWWIRRRRRTWRSLRATLGSVGLVPSRFRDGLGTAAAVGVLMQLVQLAGSRQREALADLLAGGRILYLLPLALVLLLATAAFTEEFFFRGVLQARLAAWCRSWLWAVLITSVVFSLFHFPYAFLDAGWPSAGDPGHALRLAFANGLPGGLLLGWVYVRGRGNLFAPMLTHAMINLIPAMGLLHRLLSGGSGAPA